MPSLAQLQHQARVRRLDSYIKQLLRTRWAQRKQNGHSSGGDILGRIMQGLEVSICRLACQAHAQQDGMRSKMGMHSRLRMHSCTS